ncbi:Adenylate/guanylate cyclase catalytic domain protein [Fructobacillus pseudoficulneus]|uniref:Adenylate/guanylate cyclase catalytic domain protein n=1 Tax=Fructobacillus pseudoficulneus TaxID=220714 RepID=A0A3F3GVF2_9LACO|nr:hypothetical protein [Fructobacillus pseudoficulneus]GAP03341.1 Adenylate/guanylate cyclase catalytic domain protein [Fructobacillus pseudoficulneus]SEH43931.1 hypothetical protein SAMN05660469_1095 [Fructobacillus pseudoficulneus]
MKKVKIEWIDWVQKLTKKQLWATLLVPIAVLLILFVWRVSRGNEAYNSNWFIYFFTIFYAAAFSPAGEQIQFRLFPKSVPHNQYQVTTWSQWKQAMIISAVLVIVSLLFWPIQKQGEIAIHLIAAIIGGFVIMWTVRMGQGMLAERKNK